MKIGSRVKVRGGPYEGCTGIIEVAFPDCCDHECLGRLLKIRVDQGPKIEEIKQVLGYESMLAEVCITCVEEVF